MEELNLENLEVDKVVVPNDDEGDLISALFQAGFSDEETDLVLEVYGEAKLIPLESLMLDEEIVKIMDRFEVNGLELGEEDLDIIRKEFGKRF